MAIERTDSKARIPETMLRWIADGKPRGAHYRNEPGGKVVREWSLSEMRERLEARRHGAPAPVSGRSVEAMRARLRVAALKHGMPL